MDRSRRPSVLLIRFHCPSCLQEISSVKDYLIVFTPFFRVHGLKRTVAPSKPNERQAPVPPAKTSTDKLIQMLIQKGVLSDEEGRVLYQP
jgi:hypothetical protein